MKFADLPHGDSALSIFPCVPGFGWILFDGPLSPVAWGVSTIAASTKGSDQKNTQCVKQAETLLYKYRPNMLVLEAFEKGTTRRAERTQRLCRSLISLAVVNGIGVRIITRGEIRSSFTSAHAKTRYDVAKIAASYLTEIRHRLPDKRRFYDTEDPKMALFAAAALLIVHYANPQEPL